MTPEKVGRAVAAVRFDWQWKTIDEARETDEENAKPDIARRKPDMARDAPPLSVVVEKEGTAEERAAFADRVMREAGLIK